MNETQKYFGILDYIIFFVVLLISAGIGIYYRFTGGRQKTFREYLLADQTMSIIPVAFSLMASFMSAISILGVSNEIYSFGTQFIIINTSYILGTPIVCYLYLPVFYKLQKYSVYEYLELRFGRVTRLLASLAFSLQMTLYMGIVLFAPALALSAVTGISETLSILSVGIVCTFYSAIGGMKAVLITDVFQSLLMFAAVLAVIFKGLMDFGFRDIFAYAAEGQRLEFFNLSLDPRTRHTLWNLGIGGIFTYCSIYGVNQAQVQRLLTVRSLKKAQASLWLQWVILMGLSYSIFLVGLVLYAQYRNCDPLRSKQIINSDQVLPFYVVEKLGHIPGVSGLFVSGIFSGSLSSVSSAVNSLAAVTVQDYILPFFPSLTEAGDYKASALGKVITMLFGVLCIGIAFLAQFVGTGVLQASLTIFGAVGGPLLSVFTMGILCRKANQKGAVCGLLAGLILTLWIGFGRPKPSPPFKPFSVQGCRNGTAAKFQNSTNMVFGGNAILAENGTILPRSDLVYDHIEDSTHVDDYNPLHELYAVSYMWVATIGFLCTFIVGLLVSWVTGGLTEDLDKNLLSKYIWNKSDRAQELSYSNEKVTSVLEDGAKNFTTAEQVHL